MSSGYFIMACIVGLAACMLVSSIALRRLGVRQFSVSFAVGHFFFIATLAVMYFTGPIDAQSELFWLFPGVLDIPIALVLLLFSPSDMGALGVACCLAVLGSLQYGVIGGVVDWTVSKHQKRVSIGGKPRDHR